MGGKPDRRIPKAVTSAEAAIQRAMKSNAKQSDQDFQEAMAEIKLNFVQAKDIWTGSKNCSKEYEFKEIAPCFNFGDLFEDAISRQHDTLKDNMNQFYSKSGEITIPWAIQAVSMPHVLKGQYDVLICACFGAGKTISYAYPIVCNVIKQIQQAKTNTNTNLDKKEIYALIIVPNPALASQVFGIFKNLCEETGVSVDVSHVGIKPTDVNKQKREDGANILICEAPHLKFYFLESSDRKRTNNDKLEMKHLRYIVLDEVQDLIGGFLNSKGKSFYSEYIGPLIRDVVDEIRNMDYQLIFAGTEFDIDKYKEFNIRPNGLLRIESSTLPFSKKIQHEYIYMTQNNEIYRDAELVKFLKDFYEKHDSETRMLIFANKADKVKHLFGFLIAHFPGVYIDMHHEEMSPADQAIIRNDFREGLFDVLITTDCLAKGMNLQVDHVVNFECPYDQTRLFAARVGRLGSSGTQYCFYNPNSDFAMTDTFNKYHKTSESFPLPTSGN